MTVSIGWTHELAVRVDADGTEINLMAMKISCFLPSEIGCISDERLRIGSHQILDLMEQNRSMMANQTSCLIERSKKGDVYKMISFLASMYKHRIPTLIPDIACCLMNMLVRYIMDILLVQMNDTIRYIRVSYSYEYTHGIYAISPQDDTCTYLTHKLSYIKSK